MRIKVFKAPSMKEAMVMVKDELGNDAVILHTKKYQTGGFLGLHTKEMFEVTAAVDDQPKRPRLPKLPSLETVPQVPMLPKSILSAYTTSGTEAGLEAAQGLTAADYAAMAPSALGLSAPQTVAPGQMPAAQGAVAAEAQAAEPKPKPKAIKASQEAAPAPEDAEMSDEPEEELAEEEAAEERAPSRAKGRRQSSRDKDDKIQKLENELSQMKAILAQIMSEKPQEKDEPISMQNALRDQEVDEAIVEDMVQRMPFEAIMGNKDAPAGWEALKKYLFYSLHFSEGIGLRKDKKPKVVALIGATGVGKTTTLAKIAASFVLEQGVTAALITADTYRISAVEQLKTYSDILGLPLEIVYSPKELKDAIRKHRDKQLILIDTAGRSQHNDRQVQELKDLFAIDQPIEKHLVLSATTKERDAEDILNRFSVCAPERIIFTKVDETNTLGLIINLLSRTKLSLSYLTTGQSVPDDIIPAKVDRLVEFLLR